MAKRALLVGCNYPGTENALDGCVNDVFRTKDMLLTRFGFEEHNIVVMIDTDKEYPQPTGANIRKALNKIAMNTEPGDVLVMHYSGHGVQVPAESGVPDDTGFDECIVPTDMNLITDDDFREIVNKLPSGVTLTIISDSCHSGGLIDHSKEQIGNSTAANTGIASRAFHLSSYQASRGRGGNTSREFHFPGQDEPTGQRGYSDRNDREDPVEPRYGGYQQREEHRREDNYGRGSRFEDPQRFEEPVERPPFAGHREEYGRPRFGNQEHHERHEYGRREDEEERDRRGGFERPYPGEGRRVGYEEPERLPRPSHGGEYGRNEAGRYESEYGGNRTSHGGYDSNKDDEEYRGGRQEVTSGGWFGGDNQAPGSGSAKNRGLSLSSFMSMFGKKTGKKVEEGSVRTSLYSAFGEDASPMVQMFVGVLMKHGPAIMAQMSGGGDKNLVGLLSSIALDFVMSQGSGGGIPGLSNTEQDVAHATPVAQQAAQSDNDAPLLAGYKPPPEEQVRGDMGILISGCQAKETSSDANPDGNPKNAYGAMSNAIQTVLAEKQGTITYYELVKEVRSVLKKQGYNQNPGLYCSDENAQAPFICDI